MVTTPPTTGGHGSAVTDVRSLFVSDVHLGSRHSRAAELTAYLATVRCDAIYLVGDIFDGWRLSAGWHWRPEFSRLIAQLLRRQALGTRLFYTPGNHDEFLRPFVQDFGVVDVADEFVHTSADGRRWLVTHGDRFDAVERGHAWLSRLGARAYEGLLTVNTWHDGLRRRLGHPPARLSAKIKRSVKSAVAFTSRFEQALVAAAEESGCAGVICGHIHTPRLADLGGAYYLNAGDWVESCTALAEHHDGSWSLFRAEDGRTETLDTLPAATQAADPLRRAA